MRRKGLFFGSGAALVCAALVSCSASSASSAGASDPGSASVAAKAATSPSCTLKTTFDYIVRDSNPGASVMAQEIGNVDIVNCTDSLSNFTATAGQASGECTTIVKASDNPGYDVKAVPAAPLKDVIQSAGPGC
ncbi:MAG TPA: hypothetical protein VFB06_29530 [Streptosporangiaceae bacterium]|nr:hypothetical protein [Streptosporangiaceae bacterium]